MPPTVLILAFIRYRKAKGGLRYEDDRDGEMSRE